MKYFLSLILLFICLENSFGQEKIRYRVIFIGDTGEMNPEQQKSLLHAAGHILPEKTTVMFLGDNIYPRGMGLPGSAEEPITQRILKSQFEPMRAKGAPTYFVPGNHDWDKSGRDGLLKIQRQGQFLNQQNDSLLKLIPVNGCPDPVELNLTDSLTVIAYDSEWWLFPYKKTNPDCGCKTREDVLARMREIKLRNEGKYILLASHHPFQSYGTHGGKYSLKDHIFPLTAVKKYLYIPLPIIGSLYPLLRTVFKNPEDLKHPLYKQLIKQVYNVFDNSAHVVYVAGHEHGLQFIKSKQVQIVSGAGAKHSYIKKGKYSLFSDSIQGFVTVDLMSDEGLYIRFYVYSKGDIRETFSYKIGHSAM